MTMNEAAMKSMFVETALNKMPTKPLILGIGIAGWGHHEKIKSRQVDNIYICSDEDSPKQQMTFRHLLRGLVL